MVGTYSNNLNLTLNPTIYLQSKHLFQRVVAQEKDDSELSQAILTKIQELTPPPEELAKLQEQVKYHLRKKTWHFMTYVCN